MPTPTVHRVELEPIGRRVEVSAGATLLDAAQAAGVDLVAVCGGIGSCGTCRVRRVSGALAPPTLTEEGELTREELAAGFRLACQAEVTGPVVVDIPPEALTAPQRLQLEGEEETLDFDPVVGAVEIVCEPPTLHDLRSDLDRVQAALAVQGIGPVRAGLPVLAELSTRLRDQEWRASLALWRGEIAGVQPAGGAWYGLAVDVGTTKLAAYLVDLQSGKTVAKAGAMNPQIAYGEDVVSRVAYTDTHPDGRRLLQRRLVDTLADLADGLAAQAGAARRQIAEAVIVGNTAMHHLVAGLPVTQLGHAPYVPSVSAALEFPALAIGLELAPGAHIYLPPNIAGYVGADHVAMLLATGFGADRKTTVALDIGTNTEISLYHRGHHASCSCASGPAFEGAHIHDGMRAAPGAIERVQVIGADVQVHTIDHQPAVGICGSGILDAVAQMLATGMLDARGALTGEHPRLETHNGARALVLVPAEHSGHGRPVVVTRRDVNEIQLAKGAIRAGVEVLLAEAGITDQDIESFVIAGAFGTYLDLESAVRIGMFPDLPRERFRQAGNAAGTGARQLLLSDRMRRQAAQMVAEVDYVELTTHVEFPELYFRALTFGRVE